MRTYLSLHPAQNRSYSPEELDMLDALLVRVVDILGITDAGDRNEAAARILQLYTLGGRSIDEIVELGVRLHRQGYAPGGRRSDEPHVKRIGTERQRRKPEGRWQIGFRPGMFFGCTPRPAPDRGTI